ncbi:hypothetical protein C8Q75DRAFT_863749 [Abortiporus biennis]|nr:hypothetical protein C8Q75DRAFT_863749 [Abortiporus biennis]
MAVLVRLKYHLQISCLLLFLATTISAKPTPVSPTPTYGIVKRIDTIIRNDNGTITVLDPVTSAETTQGPASDGSGYGFDAPALIWLVFSFAVGVPLAFAGIRLWRATTGAAIGLAVTVSVWAAFVNTLSASGISDILLTVLCIGAFVLGFALGVFNFGRVAGVIGLGLLGGIAFGCRLVMFGPNLIVPVYFVNWMIITFLGVLGFLLIIVRQRAGILTACASVGTFLTALGIDLLVNRQTGMSFGLRYLFDRNNAHLAALYTDGWHPPISTEIIMAVSIALIPVLAYGQHRIFKAPFKPVKPNTILQSIVESERRNSEEVQQLHVPIPRISLKHSNDSDLDTSQASSLMEKEKVPGSSASDKSRFSM